MNKSVEKLQYQPSYIKYLEFTEEELELKLKKMYGIIAAHIAISMEQSIKDRFTSNKYGRAIESMVFNKIKTSEVSKRIFLYWYNNNEELINQIISQRSLKGLDLYSIACLIDEVESEILRF